jgi:hypothetical protein
MIAKWREGFDVVYGVRAEREGETWFKKITAKMFYRIIHRITSVNIPLDTGDFRLMDRKVVEAITHMRERNRFLRGMVPWVGFRQVGVSYKRDARFAGQSKFSTLRPMLKFALNAITSFSYVPLHLATYLGFIIAVLAARGHPRRHPPAPVHPRGGVDGASDDAGGGAVFGRGATHLARDYWGVPRPYLRRGERTAALFGGRKMGVRKTVGAYCIRPCRLTRAYAIRPYAAYLRWNLATPLPVSGWPWPKQMVWQGTLASLASERLAVAKSS